MTLIILKCLMVTNFQLQYELDREECWLIIILLLYYCSRNRCPGKTWNYAQGTKRADTTTCSHLHAHGVDAIGSDLLFLLRNVVMRNAMLSGYWLYTVLTTVRCFCQMKLSYSDIECHIDRWPNVFGLVIVQKSALSEVSVYSPCHKHCYNFSI